MNPNSELLVKQFWPTTFFTRTWSEHSTEVQGIIDYLLSIRNAQSARIASGVAPIAKSSYGLYESHFDLFACDHPGLNKLKGFIGKTVQLAVAQVNNYRDDPQRLKVMVTDSWFHITNDGGFHDAHTHGHCSWCGIYYVQIGDSGQRIDGGAPNGGNRFYSPIRTGGMLKDFGNHYLDFGYADVPMNDGMLVLFPSYLQHSGLPYRGAKDRIVISFNSHVTLA